MHTFFFLFSFFFYERKMGRGANNVAILLGRDHSSTLPAGSEALLGCRRTIESHSFPTPRGILMNFELLRVAIQVSPYSDLNLGPHTHRILFITQDH